VLAPALCLYDDNGASAGSGGGEQLGYSYTGNSRERIARFSLDPEPLKNPEGLVFIHALPI